MEFRCRERLFSLSSDKLSDAESFAGTGLQNLGSNFEFEADEDALQSIMENRGIQQAQRYETKTNLHKNPTKSVFTPLHRDQANSTVEWFEGKDGSLFFRRKVLTPVQESHHVQTKPSTMKPVRFGSGNKENRERHQLTQTERKQPNLMIPPPQRQSISERKPKSLLPMPMDRSVARKSLYFGKEKKKDVFKMPDVPKVDNRHRREECTGLPMAPLTQLSRESLHLLPRESLAWIAQLPRDSATFFEIEKMMGEDDKKLVNEDDTMSFEAMESRLKTPLRITTTSRFKQDESPERPLTPAKEEHTPVKGNIDISDELMNLPANPILSTPTIKSSSMSNLSVSESKVRVARTQSEENIGNNVEVSRMISAEELLRYEKEIQEYRKEQDELERQQQELFKKISERKSAFKQQWGVSPMNINKVRTKLPTRPVQSVSVTSQLDPAMVRSYLPNDAAVVSSNISADPARIRPSESDQAPSLAFSNPVPALPSSVTVPTPLLPSADSATVLPSAAPAPILPSADPAPILPSADPAPILPSADPAPDLPSGDPAPVLSSGDPAPVLPSVLKTPGRANNVHLDEPPNTEARKVRFDSGNNQSKFLTPDSSFQATPLPENHSPNNSLSNKSFASLKSSFSFLQTPGTAPVAEHPKKRFVQRFEDDKEGRETEPKGYELGAPTPVALKSLSERVKAEFARLYADSDESEEVSTDIAAKLRF